MPDVTHAGQPDFTGRLGRLAGRYPDGDPHTLAEMVRAVLVTGPDTLSGSEAALLVEIEDLAAMVANARADVAALGADDITASHIPSATDELDAIVTHTATATDSILECCETLEAMMARLAPAEARLVQDSVTRIYEACSFQDITGQRISKVVATLQAIEQRVTHMIEVFKPGMPAQAAVMHPGPVHGLLNGPQLPDAAMAQSDIDALLASFD